LGAPANTEHFDEGFVEAAFLAVEIHHGNAVLHEAAELGGERGRIAAGEFGAGAVAQLLGEFPKRADGQPLEQRRDLRRAR